MLVLVITHYHCLSSLQIHCSSFCILLCALERWCEGTTSMGSLILWLLGGFSQWRPSARGEMVRGERDEYLFSVGSSQASWGISLVRWPSPHWLSQPLGFKTTSSTHHWGLEDIRLLLTRIFPHSLFLSSARIYKQSFPKLF